MGATIPVSSPAGHQNCCGWSMAGRGLMRESLVQHNTCPFGPWHMGRAGCPQESSISGRAQVLDIGKAQTYSWCEPGKGQPEDREGCQNCSLSKAQGRPGAFPCTTQTRCPGPLCVGFQHQQSFPVLSLRIMRIAFQSVWALSLCGFAVVGGIAVVFQVFFLKGIKVIGTWGLPGCLSLVSFFFFFNEPSGRFQPNVSEG